MTIFGVNFNKNKEEEGLELNKKLAKKSIKNSIDWNTKARAKLRNARATFQFASELIGKEYLELNQNSTFSWFLIRSSSYQEYLHWYVKNRIFNGSPPTLFLFFEPHSGFLDLDRLVLLSGFCSAA